MSSPHPSSTQHSDTPSPHPPSTKEDSSFSSQNSQDSSRSDHLQEILALQSQGIHYAAKNDISSQCEFVYNKDVKGDMLIPKDGTSLSEFILAGIFEIDARNFFLTSDGKWNANNTLGTRLDQVKPSCHLLPVQRNPTFSFSNDDFPNILANIRAIENQGNPRKSRESHSIIINDSSQSSAIKVLHHLFVVHRLFIVFMPNPPLTCLSRIRNRLLVPTTTVCLSLPPLFLNKN
jgi:hypothetical protein